MESSAHNEDDEEVAKTPSKKMKKVKDEDSDLLE